MTLGLGFWQGPNPNPSHTACDRLQASGGAYPAPLQALLDDLLALTAPGRQPPLHWRYALLANLALILLLPPPDKARLPVQMSPSLLPSAAPCNALRSLCR